MQAMLASVKEYKNLTNLFQKHIALCKNIKDEIENENFQELINLEYEVVTRISAGGETIS